MNDKFWQHLKEKLKYEFTEVENLDTDIFVNFLKEEWENFEEPIDKLRAHYFAMRDILWSEGSTGYSKVELHELAKKYIFPKLIEDPDNFIAGGKQQEGLSVTWLSEKGWKIFNEEFKTWSIENFNIYL